VGEIGLINSQLVIGGLARASGNDAACTSVVTNYHNHDPGAFSIEVEYFAFSELVRKSQNF